MICMTVLHISGLEIWRDVGCFEQGNEHMYSVKVVNSLSNWKNVILPSKTPLHRIKFCVTLLIFIFLSIDKFCKIFLSTRIFYYNFVFLCYTLLIVAFKASWYLKYKLRNIYLPSSSWYFEKMQVGLPWLPKSDAWANGG